MRTSGVKTDGYLRAFSFWYGPIMIKDKLEIGLWAFDGFGLIGLSPFVFSLSLF